MPLEAFLLGAVGAVLLDNLSWEWKIIFFMSMPELSAN